MAKNNQGVTLVELIVVIIIIGILAGGTMVGIKSLDSGNTRSTMERIDALLDYTRLLNMSKENDYKLVINQEGGVFQAIIQSTTESGTETVLTEKLKLKAGNITYTSSLGSFSIAGVYSLKIGYTKNAGRIIIYPDEGEIKSITISGGSRSYTIQLVTATGKHYLK